MTISTYQHHPQLKGLPRAFTLVEILIAISISAVIMLAAQSAFKQAGLIWTYQETGRTPDREVLYLINVLRQELAGAYLPSLQANPPQTDTPPADDMLPTDTEQNQDTPPLVFVGRQNDDGSKHLEFFTVNPSWGRISSPYKQPCRVIYQLLPEPSSTEPCWRLERSWQHFAGSKPIGPIQTTTVLNNIHNMSLDFYTPSEDPSAGSWQSNYVSQRQTPPALRLSLTIAQEDPVTFKPHRSTWQALLPIPCQVKLKGF